MIFFRIKSVAQYCEEEEEEYLSAKQKLRNYLH